MIIQIRTPIWKSRSVGISHAHLKKTETDGGTLIVEILYENVHGERLFPGMHYIPVTEAMTYPTQIVKGVKLHIIPIDDFASTRKKKSVKDVKGQMKLL